MMHPRDWSIRKKLIGLGFVSSALALILACAGFVLHDVQWMRAAAIRENQSQAQSLASSATDALVFRDADAASRLLQSLHSRRDVIAARVYDADGCPLASYGSAAESLPQLAPTEAISSLKSWKELEIVQPVVDRGESIGALYIRAELSQLNGQIVNYGIIVGIVAIAALVSAVLCSMRLARRFSFPLQRLAETARRISAQHDYSLRAEVTSRDELGETAAAFNEMLEQMEASKEELRRANDELEDRVRQRTSQLSDEIIRRELVYRELLESKEIAEQANRAKSEFLANMSHEIRTPLNGILGFTNLLLRGAAEDEQEEKEFLTTIHNSGDHLLTLINDILDLSKIEAGQLDIERIDCPTQMVLSEVISVLRVKAQEKGLALDCRWSTPIPQTIRTDPARLRQLLMNLIGNAVKFTQSGSVTVTPRLDANRPDPKLFLDIVDTGIGISPDKLDAIFDPFVQADTSVTRRFGGTGLGLAICRKLANALGGEIAVASTLGTGSTFTLSVDTGSLEGVDLVAASDSEAVSRREEKSVVKKAVSLEGVRVLLVEDGETNRRLIGLVLTRARAHVDTAENGLVGVDRAMNAAYDLILMDMQMPVLDGYSAAALLREQGCEVPIVALTAHAMIGDEEKCIEAGCSGYLTKPIDSDLLLETVQRWTQASAQPVSPAATILKSSPLAAAEPKPSAPSQPPAPTKHPTTTPMPCETNPLSHLATLRARTSNVPPTGMLGVFDKSLERPKVLTKTPASYVSTLPLDDADFREIVAEFIDRLEQKVAAMQQAAAGRNYAELAQLAHWSKGAGGTVGFPFLTEPSARLESLSKSKADDQIEAVLEEIFVLTGEIRRVNGPLVTTATACPVI